MSHGTDLLSEAVSGHYISDELCCKKMCLRNMAAASEHPESELIQWFRKDIVTHQQSRLSAEEQSALGNTG